MKSIISNRQTAQDYFANEAFEIPAPYGLSKELRISGKLLFFYIDALRRLQDGVKSKGYKENDSGDLFLSPVEHFSITSGRYNVLLQEWLDCPAGRKFSQSLACELEFSAGAVQIIDSVEIEQQSEQVFAIIHYLTTDQNGNRLVKLDENGQEVIDIDFNKVKDLIAEKLPKDYRLQVDTGRQYFLAQDDDLLNLQKAKAEIHRPLTNADFS